MSPMAAGMNFAASFVVLLPFYLYSNCPAAFNWAVTFRSIHETSCRPCRWRIPFEYPGLAAGPKWRVDFTGPRETGCAVPAGWACLIAACVERGDELVGHGHSNAERQAAFDEARERDLLLACRHRMQA